MRRVQFVRTCLISTLCARWIASFRSLEIITLTNYVVGSLMTRRQKQHHLEFNQIHLRVRAALPVYKDPYWLDFENMHFHWCLIALWLQWTSDDFTTPVWKQSQRERICLMTSLLVVRCCNRGTESAMNAKYSIMLPMILFMKNVSRCHIENSAPWWLRDTLARDSLYEDDQ